MCPGFVNTNIANSERNRPSSLVRSQEPTINEDAAAGVAAMLENGKQPDEIAEIVVNAIKDNVFYILPHPAWDDHMRGHFELILSRKELPARTLPFLTPREDGEKY